MTTASSHASREHLRAMVREHVYGASLLRPHGALLGMRQELEGVVTGRGQFSELYSPTHCCRKIRTTRSNHSNNNFDYCWT